MAEREIPIEATEAKMLLENPYLRSDMEALEAAISEDQLAKVLEAASGLVLDSESEKKEKLLELKKDLVASMFRYMSGIGRALQVSESRVLAFHDPEKFKDLLVKTDKRRSIAHDAMIDAFNIFFRNCYKEVGEEMEPLTRQYAGDPKNKIHRRKVSDLARAFVWKRLREAQEVERKEELV